MFDLKGTLVIVTGAAKGNGKAISGALNKAGATVIEVDSLKINNELSVNGDLQEKSTIDEIIRVTTENKSKSLVLVNNAGITRPSKYPYPKEYWDETIKINLTVPFMLIEALIPDFKTKKNGSIINITSLGAEMAFPDNPAYMAAKGGLKMLTKFYAKSLGVYGIRVNNVGPGYMLTDMTQKSYKDSVKRLSREKHTYLGRWGKPDDLGGVCVFLASEEASYITGQDIYVDGGWTSNGLIE